MDPIAIGKKIKEAYPQYAKADDALLGNKYLQKYGGVITAVKSGQIKITDLPAEQRAGVGLGMAAIEPNQVDPMEAIQQVVTQGGSDFINKGKTKDERMAIAQEVMKAGGMDKYRQLLPLKDLSTEKELTGIQSSVDLKGKIDTSLPNFEQDTAGGTGPLAQYIPFFLRSPEGREKVAGVEQVRALYQQMISGKVISDREAERLKQFLPTKGKTETNNREDLKRLKDGIDLNLKLFEKGKREGLTANEAYDKYGAEIIGSQRNTRLGKSIDVNSYLDKYFK